MSAQPSNAAEIARAGSKASPITRARHRPGALTRIGITGHSDLTAVSLPVVAAVLRAALLAQTRQPWVGVSCLARGADQLFAALVLDLGGRLKVILPARDYRTRKVTPDNATEFDRLMAAATAVTVMGIDRCDRDAYTAASNAMLAEVDTVIAVWDGLPARRRGSTADVVAAAARLGLPTTILWPTGATRRLPTPLGPAPDPALLLVLAGLVFPAQRWEVVIYAEFYGADWYTRRTLARLPEGLYRDLDAVTAAAAAAIGVLRPPGGPGQ